MCDEKVDIWEGGRPVVSGIPCMIIDDLHRDLHGVSVTLPPVEDKRPNAAYPTVLAVTWPKAELAEGFSYLKCECGYRFVVDSPEGVERPRVMLLRGGGIPHLMGYEAWKLEYSDCFGFLTRGIRSRDHSIPCAECGGVKGHKMDCSHGRGA